MDRPSIVVHRPVCTLQELYNQNDIVMEPEKPFTSKLKSFVGKTCTFSWSCFKSTLADRLPVLRLLASYKWKNYLLPDLIAGLSVGVIHIPQGMGFALLTELPPVYGLYSSMFPVWVYFLFGTSHHISMGTMALISLMVGSVVNQQVMMRETGGVAMDTTTLATTIQTQVKNGSIVPDDESLVEFKVGIATSVTLIAGLFQLLLFLFRLDIVASYMSMPFVNSFMVGAAIHIITSQIPSVLGLSIARSSGTFSVINTYIDVFSKIRDTNIASLVISIICLVYLIFIKEFINVKYKRRIKIPIPAELLLIIIATVISEYTKLQDKCGIAVVGSIKTGFPGPKVPSMHGAGSYIIDGILVGVVAFAISITMAKMMSTKHNYTINTRQELLAYGLQNVTSSFFQCFAGTQAPPRTLVHESVGGRTQLANLVSTALPLAVTLALGPLFRSLPNAVLGSIIIAALLPLLKKFSDLPMYWRVNVYDFIVWVVTLISVVVLSVAIGLGVGIGCGFVLVVIQTQLVKGNTLLSKHSPDIYVTTKKTGFRSVVDVSDVRVLRFESNLYFATVDNFKRQILTLIPNGEKAASNTNSNSSDPKSFGSGETKESTFKEEIRDVRKVFTVVLDCSSINYIDIMGIDLLKHLAERFKKDGNKLCLAACGADMLTKLTNGGIGFKEDIICEIDEEDVQETGCPQQLIIYPTLHDAVVDATGHTEEVVISVL